MIPVGASITGQDLEDEETFKVPFNSLNHGRVVSGQTCRGQGPMLAPKVLATRGISGWGLSPHAPT